MKKSVFDGHRIYNGCADSTLQTRWDYEESILKKIQILSPGSKCCYFPLEDKYIVHDKKYNDISKYHYSKITALEEAIAILEINKIQK